MVETQNPEIMFSFICPVYNEQEGLDAFYRRLVPVLAKLGEPCEIIFINDGSTDDTAGVIRRLGALDPNIRYVEFSRNFGHQTAVTAGYDYACGRVVICMDADCQHPPELITEMVARWREGFEVVNAVPQDGNGRAPSACGAGSRLLLKLLGLAGAQEIEQTDFRLMDRRAVDAFRQAREHARLVRGLVNWIGFRQIIVPYKSERPSSSSYRLRQVAAMSAAEMYNFSSRPLKIAPVLGAVLLAIAAVYAVISLALWPLNLAPGGVAHVAMAVVALFGMQFLLMGLLGEYIARIFEESKGRPLYVVREVRGFEPPAKEEPQPEPAKQDKPQKRFVLYT